MTSSFYPRAIRSEQGLYFFRMSKVCITILSGSRGSSHPPRGGGGGHGDGGGDDGHHGGDGGRGGDAHHAVADTRRPAARR